MPTVILEGPGAGWTEVEYGTQRNRIDCHIAKHLGWTIQTDGFQTWWQNPIGKVFDRDDQERGIPHFSFGMEQAWTLITLITREWSFIARQKFWENLQAEACYDPVSVTRPQYPEVFESLAHEMPLAICKAFIATVDYHKARNFSLTTSSARAVGFADAIERQEVDEVLENGSIAKRLKIKLPAGPPPWVR